MRKERSAALRHARDLLDEKNSSSAKLLLEDLLCRFPDDAEILQQLALTELISENLASATEFAQRAIQLQPNEFLGHFVQGTAHLMQGKFSLAEAPLRRAIEIAPGSSAARCNLSRVLLAREEFLEGWREHEYRLAFPHVDVGIGPQWWGEQGCGLTLKITADEGMGDCIMLARFVRKAAEAFSGALVFEVHSPLWRLMSHNFDDIAYVIPRVNNARVAPEYHRWIPLSSIAHRLGENGVTFSDEPYLSLPESEGVDVDGLTGLVWRGNPEYSNDRNRSIPVEDLECLRDAADWISVLPEHSPPSWCRPCPELPDFAATAALLKRLKLLVTCDTAIAHLAGALGVKTYLILPLNGEWRWGQYGERTLWYRSVRLYRPTLEEGFVPVLRRIAAELTGQREEQEDA